MEYIQANSGGGNGSDVYRMLRQACNEEMSVLILGNTMTTTEARTSGYAQSKVHERTEDEIRKDDRRRVVRMAAG